MTGRDMHRAYTREVVRRIRAAIQEAAPGCGLRMTDIDTFHLGCRDGGHGWAIVGHRLAAYRRLERAGLLAHGAGLSLFGARLTRATVTERGRHALWLIEQAYHDCRPMFRAALRQQAEERRTRTRLETTP